MYQPGQSGGQLTEPLRPLTPAPVRTAIKLMYASAAVSTVPLVIALVYSGDISAYHLTVLGHRLTTAQLSHWRPLIITLVIVGGLAVPAVWLCLARANGQARHWARTLSTVLFGLATLSLASVFATPVHGVASPAPIAVLTWLAGLAVVWLLWRPASSAFFKPQAFARAGQLPDAAEGECVGSVDRGNTQM